MLACPLAFFIIYQKLESPGFLCTGLFDFIWVLEIWLGEMLFAVRRVIDIGSLTMLLPVQVMMLKR
jgi:hypothetical protein